MRFTKAREGNTSPSNHGSIVQCTIATMEDKLSPTEEKGKEVIEEQEELYNQIEEIK